MRGPHESARSAVAMVATVTLVAVAFVGGCSDDTAEEGAEGPASTEPTAEQLAWCDDFVTSYWQIDSLNEDPEILSDPEALDAAYQQAEDAWAELAPAAPPEIRDDARTVQRGVAAMRLDPEDEDASILYDESYLEAAERVEQFVRETCGEDLDAPR